MGTVAFYNGVNLLGNATLINGRASIKAFLPSGRWPLKAVFLGGASAVLSQTVDSMAGGSFFDGGALALAPGTALIRWRWAISTATASPIIWWSPTKWMAPSACCWGRAIERFGQRSAIRLGTAPQSVIVADFNGDGNLDLATANYYSSNVSVLLGKGDGTFEAAVNYKTAANPWTVAARGLQRRPTVTMISLSPAAAAM